jgi:hypothetical protein
MSGQRLARWLAVPIAFVAVALVLSRFQPGVDAGRRTAPPVASACAGPAPIGRAAGERGSGAAGGGSDEAIAPGRAWWRITDALDAGGTLVGRTLVAGVGARTTLTMALGPESMARGPVGGLLVVTSDDGATSTIKVVAIAEACAWLVHEDANVVRSAILDRRGRVVYAHLVQRETRLDLGVFRASGGEPQAPLDRVLEPLAPQADLGPIWATELRLDVEGASLAVQSCSDRGCLTRVVSLTAFGQPVTEIRGAGQGSILGFAGDRIVTWAFCDGLPCALQTWTAGEGRGTTIADRAVGAGLTADGRYLLVVPDGVTGRAIRIDLGSGGTTGIDGVAAGELPLGGFVTSTVGLEVAGDEIGLATPGGEPRAFTPGAASAQP